MKITISGRQGCGKSSLVNEIAEFLKEKDLVVFRYDESQPEPDTSSYDVLIIETNKKD